VLQRTSETNIHESHISCCLNKQGFKAYEE
jgi:hypothetical protein